MKKFLSILVVGAVLAVYSCGPSAEEKEAAEKAKNDSMAAATAAADKAKADSAAVATPAPADSAAAAAPAAK